MSHELLIHPRRRCFPNPILIAPLGRAGGDEALRGQEDEDERMFVMRVRGEGTSSTYRLFHFAEMKRLEIDRNG